MYPSDIVEEGWVHLAPFCGSLQDRAATRKHNIRDIINGIRYVMRSGCQWRLLPKDFPPGKQYMTNYLRWRKNGGWQEIHDRLVQKVREKASKKATPTVGIIDSQSVKISQKGGLEV